MGLLPDTQTCMSRMRREYRERSRHASRHEHHARVVEHFGIANLRFPLKSVAGKKFPAFPAHAQPALLRIWQEAHPMVIQITPELRYDVFETFSFTCIEGVSNGFECNHHAIYCTLNQPNNDLKSTKPYLTEFVFAIMLSSIINCNISYSLGKHVSIIR